MTIGSLVPAWGSSGKEAKRSASKKYLLKPDYTQDPLLPRPRDPASVSLGSCVRRARAVSWFAGSCDFNHRDGYGLMSCSSNSVGVAIMENPSLVLAISKLAAAGEQAGFTLEQMIELLDAGLEVETLLNLICLRLHAVSLPPLTTEPSARWVM